jgi:salicylate hydroxylase
MDRWLVPMDKVMAKPDLAAILSRGQPGFMGWIDPVGDVLCITYRCRRGRLLNVAVGHKTAPRQGEGDEARWNSPVSKEEVLGTLKNFHRSLQKLVDMADEDGIQSHHLYTRPPLASFVRTRAVVVGDAAHVMMPTHAAGAGIAIESAASLEVLFRGVNAKDAPTLRRRLEMFDELRIPRCNLTMLASNAAKGCFPAPGEEEETLRRFYSGPLLPPSTSPYSKPCRKLLFDHDEYRAAETLLSRDQAERL